jgi:hypothetical protein
MDAEAWIRLPLVLVGLMVYVVSYAVSLWVGMFKDGWKRGR